MTWGAFARADLEAGGFLGFHTVKSLRDSRAAHVPTHSGVYCVWRAAGGVPRFLKVTSGGRFKGRDKTLQIQALRLRWVVGAHVIYLGKGKSLRGRIRLLVDYGGGKAVGHEGGYPLWQLPASERLLVAWLPVAAFTQRENELLSAFWALHRSYPYANTAGPRG